MNSAEDPTNLRLPWVHLASGSSQCAYCRDPPSHHLSHGSQAYQARPGQARSRHGRQDRREKIRASTLDSPSQVKRQGRQSARERREGKKRAQRRGKPLSPPQPQPIHLLQTPVSRLPSAVFPFQIITDIYWDLFHLLFLLLSSFPLYLYPFPQSFFFPSPPPIFCRHLQSSTLLLFSLSL